MASPFKNYLSEDLIDSYGQILKDIYPKFKSKEFKAIALKQPWPDLELKQRMRQITEALSHCLPAHFPTAVKILIQSVDEAKNKKLNRSGIEFIFLPDFIEVNGLNYFVESTKAFEKITPFISCEFAVRPFIVSYQEAMMAKMKMWSKHSNEHLRRLASEGSRPRLPWAMALPEFKKDPRPVIPILENLKNDASEYVRRSVANNLNDISKDNPELAFSLFNKWYGQNPVTDRLVKHGMRTLLKSNYPGAMELIGFTENQLLSLNYVKLTTPKVKLGDAVSFQLSVKNKSKSTISIRIEYALYFLLSNGKHSRKIFKISERQIAPAEEVILERKHSFRSITTRKYYPGRHFVSPVINGKELKKLPFELI